MNRTSTPVDKDQMNQFIESIGANQYVWNDNRSFTVDDGWRRNEQNTRYVEKRKEGGKEETE